MLNAEKWNSLFKNSQPWGQWGLLLHILPNVDGSLLSEKRDFILGPLSLGGYFGTANLWYDYLNTTWFRFLSLRLAISVTTHLMPVYFHSYFLFYLLLLSVFTAFVLFSQACNWPYSPGFLPLRYIAMENKSVRADPVISTMGSEVGMLGLDSWGPPS